MTEDERDKVIEAINEIADPGCRILRPPWDLAYCLILKELAVLLPETFGRPEDLAWLAQAKADGRMTLDRVNKLHGLPKE